MASDRPERARYARWHAAAEMLALVRRRPDITRAAAARELNLSSGSALEISRRLRDLGLLSDSPAAVRGRAVGEQAQIAQPPADLESRSAAQVQLPGRRGSGDVRPTAYQSQHLRGGVPAGVAGSFRSIACHRGGSPPYTRLTRILLEGASWT